MLAKVADTVPAGDLLYEPKWDGFRSIVFRGGEDEVFIQSRELKPLDRYFPELHDVFLRALPAGCVVDGEIVIATDGGLDFDAAADAICIRRRRARRSWRRRRRRPSWRSTCLRPVTKICASCPRPSGARDWSACWPTPCRRST